MKSTTDFCSSSFWYTLGLAYGPRWANHTAQVTSYAFLTDNLWLAVFSKGDCLVASVSAGQVTSSATNADVAVYGWEYLGVPVNL